MISSFPFIIPGTHKDNLSRLFISNFALMYKNLYLYINMEFLFEKRTTEYIFKEMERVSHKSHEKIV